MAEDLDIIVSSSSARVLAEHFAELPRRLQMALVAPTRQVTLDMYRAVIAAEPHGTGKLRAATRWFVDVGHAGDGNWIRGRVRVLPPPGASFNIAAAAINYGALKYRPVSAHRMTLSHFWGHSVPSQDVMVTAYHRHIDVAAQHFLEAAVPAAKARWQEQVAATTAMVLGKTA